MSETFPSKTRRIELHFSLHPYFLFLNRLEGTYYVLYNAPNN